MPARSGARWSLRIIVVAACVLTVIAVAACTSAPPARHTTRPAVSRSTGPPPTAGPAGSSLAGDPNWRITHPGHLYQLEGFTDRADVLPGTSFRLFVSTTARSFRVRAFRMGWYGGDLARAGVDLAGHAGPLPAGGEDRPSRDSMAVAPWPPSLTVPDDRLAARLVPAAWLDASTGVQSYLPMVIRSPSTAGRVVLVSAVTSYQAYNGWGRYSLYGGPGGSFADRGRRVTFDRPPVVRPRGRGLLPAGAAAGRLRRAARAAAGLSSPASTSTWIPGVLAGARASDQRGARRVLVAGHARRRDAGPRPGRERGAFSAPTRSSARSGSSPRRSARTGSR